MDLNKNTVVDYQGVADRGDGSETPLTTPRSTRSYALLAALMVGIVVAVLALALLIQSGFGSAS